MGSKRGAAPPALVCAAAQLARLAVRARGACATVGAYGIRRSHRAAAAGWLAGSAIRGTKTVLEMHALYLVVSGAHAMRTPRICARHARYAHATHMRTPCTLCARHADARRVCLLRLSVMRIGGGATHARSTVSVSNVHGFLANGTRLSIQKYSECTSM